MRWGHNAFAAGVAVISVIAAAQLMASGVTHLSWGWGYVLGTLALPLVIWLCLLSPLDYVVAGVLVCQSGLAVIGATYALVGLSMIFGICGAVLIAVGIRQELRFLALPTDDRAAVDPEPVG